MSKTVEWKNPRNKKNVTRARFGKITSDFYARDYTVIVVDVGKNHSSHGKTSGKYGTKLEATIFSVCVLRLHVYAKRVYLRELIPFRRCFNTS